MKKVTINILCIGLMIALCGCGADTGSSQVDEEPKMTVVKDELVSTSDKIEEEKKEIKKQNTSEVDHKEELSEAKESVQIEKKEETAKEEPTVVVEDKANVEEQMNAFYQDGKVTKEDFAIRINQTLIHTGEDMNVMVEQLGEPDDFVQARSCLYDGDDKVYTYGGITIYTYPNGTEDIIYLIEVTGNEKLLSDIGNGSTYEDVIKVYGTDYVEFGSMIAFDLSDSASLSFELENNIVCFIEIYNE